MRNSKLTVVFRTIKFLIFVTALTMLLFFVLTQITLDYYIVQPGSPMELNQAIEVESGGDSGNFHLTTVSQSPANLFMFLYGVVNPHADIQSKEDVIPPEMDRDEYREMMQQHMQDSQNIAKTIALETLDYDVEFQGDGIKIIELVENSPVQGILQAGDIIKEVNGESFYLAEEVTDYVSNYPINESIDLVVQRNSELLTKQVQTSENPDIPGDSYLGVYIRTESWEPLLPVDIQFDTGGIGGPSAGLMFVLEIINQLTENDLSGGYSIYGTGAVALDGSVNSVGGVKYKVAASEAEGADYFLAPSNNYQEAVEASQNVEVIKIDTIEKALEFLESISTETSSALLISYDYWWSGVFFPTISSCQ